MTLEPIKPNATIGEKYNPAMEIDNRADADAYFELLVAHAMAHGLSRERAEEVERINLGYYAYAGCGFDRERVERLFRCEHPVFGAIAVRGSPTPSEAMLAGVMLAKRIT